MPDYRQSQEYSRYFLTKGWKVERVSETLILIKNSPWLGSIIKIQRASNIRFDEIEKIAKREKALFVVVELALTTEADNYRELEADFKSHGYRNLKFSLCPTKTSIIDLNKSEVDILEGFDDTVKKTIRRNQKNGLEIKIAQNLEEIYPLLHEAGKFRHFFVQPRADWKNQWGNFGDQAKVILAYKDGGLLGGNMSLLTAPQAYGLFLPTTKAGRKYNIATTLMWEGFKLARASGCSTFDLEGIYDDRYHAPKSWLGLTAFKRKFRGHEVEFIPAKIKVYAWYLKPFSWLGLL